MKIILTEDEVREMILDSINRKMFTQFNHVHIDVAAYSYIRSVEVSYVEPEPVTISASTEEVTSHVN